ncbi:MAG: YkgJ family cysteine cluster protein [Desulfobacterales bacterium]|nr:MAG: YkgJ family cysteine cluster protein [Desulfobacterales bacterium]
MTENSPQSSSGTSTRACVRCGTCCEKGGPAFHRDDRMLIEKGLIPSKYLYTIRRGEFAHDNVRGRLMPVDSDIIKIKGKEDTWTCVFFDEAEKSCTIYKDRPQECRALKCWDTQELEKIYAGRRLTRQDLMSGVVGLWDLIKDHQKRCDYEKIRNLIKALQSGHGQHARRRLAEIIRYDLEIRELVVSKGAMDPEMLDFLFGRPLTKTLPGYGIKGHRQGKKIILETTASRLGRTDV